LLNERNNIVMDGLGIIQDENKNKKIVNSGVGSGGRNRKKSKNDKSNPSHENPTNRFDIGTRSIEEIERLLYSLNEATCVHATVRMSGYNPPPSHRRVLGDLAYLEATCPDGAIVHLTAFARGFYVNRSSMTRFDPTPAIKKGGRTSGGGGGDGSNNSTYGGGDACYSHALLDCLLLSSTSLRSAWRSALIATKERSDLLVEISSSAPSSSSGANVDDFVLYNNLFRNAASSYPNNSSGPAATAAGAGGLTTNSGSPMPVTRPSTFLPRLDSLTVRPPWLVTLPSAKIGDMVGPRLSTWNHGNLHSYDASRAEEELTSYYGMDIRGGGLRDWNEELQTAREMSVDTFVERIERAR
jgi:protein TIF31